MRNIFVLLFIAAAFSAGTAYARSSSLPILFTCEMPATNQCIESYYSFEPGMTPPCGAGHSVRNAECQRTAGYLGACRTAVQGANGYFVQTVLHYYSGMMGSDPAQIKTQCEMINGEYLP